MLPVFQKNVIKLIQFELLFQLIGYFLLFALVFTLNTDLPFQVLILPITCFIFSLIYLLFYVFSTGQIRILYQKSFLTRIFWLFFGINFIFVF